MAVRLDVRLTNEGRRELEEELSRCESERHAAAARIAEARVGGNDPTENLDLRDAMDELMLLEARIGELRALLAAAEPVRRGAGSAMVEETAGARDRRGHGHAHGRDKRGALVP